MLAIEFHLSVFWIVALFLWLIVLGWIASTILAINELTRQRNLPIKSDADLRAEGVPLVSVLVPARNEELRVLADSILSILKQDYGNFEVIAINDRSTDSTGTILERLASGTDHLRVINGRELGQTP